jgi:hypothetical protein
VLLELAYDLPRCNIPKKNDFVTATGDEFGIVVEDRDVQNLLAVKPSVGFDQEGLARCRIN